MHLLIRSLPLLAAFVASVAAQPAYPILFVHGLNSCDYTWLAAVRQFEPTWGTPYTIHFDLNTSASTRAEDDFVYTDFAPFWDFETEADCPRVRGQSRIVASASAQPRVSTQTSSRLFLVNFQSLYNPADGYVYPHYVHGSTGDSESNQSAAAKQGMAVGIAVELVRQATGSDRVILVGHSMGGLAIREYLQRRNPDGTHRWWHRSDHGVAAAVTYGTPHLGSNSTLIGFEAFGGLDNDSEAVRDLRYWHSRTGERGRYLYGGSEDFQELYYNRDVNADGDEDDVIEGLNIGDPQVKLGLDNPALPLPLDVRYVYLIGNASGTGDYVVDAERQALRYLDGNNVVWFGPAGGDVWWGGSERWHFSQTEDVGLITRAIELSVAVAGEEPPGWGFDGPAPLVVYPNPTRDHATVVVTLAHPASVALAIYDAAGRLVRSAEVGARPAGSTPVELVVSDLPAGVYFLVSEIDGRRGTAAPLSIAR